MTQIDRYLAGQAIWGDDMDDAGRSAWFKDEEHAYVELYAADPDYEYEYDTVNAINGFRYLPPGRRFRRVLGLGSAYGDELRPIADRIQSVVVVESSNRYEGRRAVEFPLEFRKSGDLPLEDASVDLAVCFGVLHHIPNVTHVIHELGRVVEPHGYALIREPIISMGDWRVSRPGLTPRERGIPRKLLLESCQAAGFKVEKERLCFFPGTGIIARRLGRGHFDDPTMVRLDAVLSQLTAANYRYHATNIWQKVRPTSSFLTLKRM
jgi:SAM-dependent methyltransferase